MTSPRVTIYTTRRCPHCQRAKDLLTRKGISFKEIDVTDDEEKRREAEKRSGWMTVPMIFIGDEFIGGADDLHALEESGELERKISNPS
jgi:glutaredoxin 3